MKTMLAFVAGVLILSACNNEDVINENLNENSAKLVTLTAYQEGEGGTRTAIDGTTSTQIDWTADDKINYFGGATGESMTLSTGAGTAIGTFSGEVTTSENDYVLYPYNAEATCASGTITTTIPSAQSVPAGTFDPKAGLMVAKVNGTSIQFYNAVGYIAIKIPAGTGNITKMVITGNNNERLSGKVTISGIATDAAPTSINGTTRTITDATSPTGVTDGVKYVEVTPYGTPTFKTGSTYYVAVAPDATLSKGIYVLLYDGAKTDPTTLKLAVKKSSRSLEMARAEVIKVTLPSISNGDWKGMIALNGCYLAPFNLGATASIGTEAAAFGNYYSWGEVDTKSAYSSSAYTGTTALTGLTDAATSNWGPDWRIPTNTEWKNNTSNSSVVGLPLAACYYGTKIYNSDLGKGLYWSSTPYTKNNPDPKRASFLTSDGTTASTSNRAVHCGCTVRPVLAQ